jgi:hypothetical protein
MGSTGVPERITDAICAMCGNVLIELEPPNHMCTTCNAKLDGLSKRAVANRKENTGSPRRMKIKIPAAAAQKIIAQRGYGG